MKAFTGFSRLIPLLDIEGFQNKGLARLCRGGFETFFGETYVQSDRCAIK